MGDDVDRQTRLKEAKQEAMREIETLKATKEGEFKKILNQVRGIQCRLKERERARKQGEMKGWRVEE